MNIILFDDPAIRQNLLPLTFTRPVAYLRVGILTLAEKWQQRTHAVVSTLAADYLQHKYNPHAKERNYYVNGALLPSTDILQELSALGFGESVWQNGILLAYHGNYVESNGTDELLTIAASSRKKDYAGHALLIKDLWEIFLYNGQEIRSDYEMLTEGRQSEPIGDKHTIVYNEENIFIEKGVKIRAAILNAENGPIYIGKNAQIHEGAVIKGPFSLGEESHINVGGKMRGDVSIGPFCKVGGEVAASVIFGYTNKGHEGYLGNSVLGEWCNIGADTNTSNLKNNYAEVKIWNYAKGGFKNTGQQFCGLIMGDHSKCGINTMFNTGTVVGVSANIFGPGFPRNFIPSFSWGGAAGFETFQMRKVVEVAEKVMERRNKKLDEVERGILNQVFEQTKQYRVWDKKI
ncbi:GlmU family protein [Pontibacter oryzae]|uniref:Glucose-1-phosphate thymidylyltransferase n=1 Tax=Pontibacter oryzae TaxID=2304593 RepID=A0A399S2T9_9BACT|nr:GlmU family protein [Pontibacter oryzae]RIJ36873.1 glucose-1-phosphate thymidylyltransferase [Pontibacter oryzae]